MRRFLVILALSSSGCRSILGLDQPIVLDATIDAAADPRIDAFACANDSVLEPNDTILSATPTPVAMVQASVQYAGLAICPATDRDNFAVTLVGTNHGLEALVDYATDNMPGVMILDSNGGMIANGATDPTPHRLRVSIAVVPMGTYYVVVSSSTGENNYKLTITAGI